MNMSKLATGVAYGASAGTVANGLLTRLSPDEWSAVGVIAGIIVALATFGVNVYFKWKTNKALMEAIKTRGYPTTEQLTEE